MICKPQPQHPGLARGNISPVKSCGFRALPGRVNRLFFAADQVAVKGILYIRITVGEIYKARSIGFIVGEKQALCFFRIEVVFSGGRMDGFYNCNIGPIFNLTEIGLARYISHGPPFIAPAPGVAKPEGGQDITIGWVRAPVGDRDLD